MHVGHQRIDLFVHILEILGGVLHLQARSRQGEAAHFAQMVGLAGGFLSHPAGTQQALEVQRIQNGGREGGRPQHHIDAGRIVHPMHEVGQLFSQTGTRLRITAPIEADIPHQPADGPMAERGEHTVLQRGKRRQAGGYRLVAIGFFQLPTPTLVVLDVEEAVRRLVVQGKKGAGIPIAERETARAEDGQPLGVYGAGRQLVFLQAAIG